MNKLISIIDEEPSSFSLEIFLKQVTDYCQEFYHELNIEVIVVKKDQKNFTFKHAALTETIFHIFTFITRGNFDTDNNTFTLKAHFLNKNSFPSIIIEAPLSEGSLTGVSWESGPSYVYTSLLSIYLLAKENKLFFNIAKKDNKIIFTLDPIDKKIGFYDKAFDLDNLRITNNS